MSRRFWIGWMFLVCVSAFGQKPEVTPEITKAQRQELAVKYQDYMYAMAELKEYIADMEAKHPGWRVTKSSDDVWSFFKPPVPPPNAKLPPPVTPAK